MIIELFVIVITLNSIIIDYNHHTLYANKCISFLRAEYVLAILTMNYFKFINDVLGLIENGAKYERVITSFRRIQNCCV